MIGVVFGRNYSIVGMDRLDSARLLSALEPNTVLTLMREPTNKFDKNAIAVWLANRIVGYIPSKQNKELAMYIDTYGELRVKQSSTKDSVSVEARAVDARFVRSPNSAYPMVQLRAIE